MKTFVAFNILNPFAPRRFLNLILTLFLVFWIQNSLAEKITPLEPLPEGSIEAFQPVVEPGLARALAEFPVYTFYLGSPDINGVAFVPNFSPRVGAHLSWKDMGLTYTAALPLPKEEIVRRGNSDQLNVLFNRHWRSFGLDLYYQQYRGFYIASPFTELSLNKPNRYPQLPDAEVLNYGFNYYQVLSPEKYSLGASFSQSELQLIDGGSWILTVFYNHLQMERGQNFLPGSNPNSTQVRPELESGTFHTLGGGGGYGQTWVRNKAFLTAQGIAGIGAQVQKVDELASDIQGHIHLAMKLNLNLAIGYSPQNYVIGGKVLADALISSIRETQVYSTLINGQIFFGTRF